MEIFRDKLQEQKPLPLKPWTVLICVIFDFKPIKNLFSDWDFAISIVSFFMSCTHICSMYSWTLLFQSIFMVNQMQLYFNNYDLLRIIHQMKILSVAVCMTTHVSFLSNVYNILSWLLCRWHPFFRSRKKFQPCYYTWLVKKAQNNTSFEKE